MTDSAASNGGVTTPPPATENDYPKVSDLLRQRLVDSLIATGTLAGDAEVIADEAVAFARTRAAELQARRLVTPSTQTTPAGRPGGDV